MPDVTDDDTNDNLITTFAVLNKHCIWPFGEYEANMFTPTATVHTNDVQNTTVKCVR